MSKYVNPRIAAEAAYKNAWAELFTVATGLEVPALHAAVRRFRAAAITLSVTRPARTGATYTVQRDLTITEAVTLCLSCGEPVRPKGRQHGPRQLYCSTKCRNREYKQRYRRKKAEAAA